MVNCLSNMAEGGPSRALQPEPEISDPSTSGSLRVCRQTLPLSCPECFVSYRNWILAYDGKYDKLVKYSQDHGLILRS